LAVTTTVVHDQVFIKGELAEDTEDWFAQDKEGNVWYFGEDTKELANGQVVSTQGSWEAGVDKARAGIFMPAAPKVGQVFRQEDAKNVAEDCSKDRQPERVGQNPDRVVEQRAEDGGVLPPGGRWCSRTSTTFAKSAWCSSLTRPAQ
jgi:hypothetical protein